jgi:hypothetical protein
MITPRVCHTQMDVRLSASEAGLDIEFEETRTEFKMIVSGETEDLNKWLNSLTFVVDPKKGYH